MAMSCANMLSTSSGEYDGLEMVGLFMYGSEWSCNSRIIMYTGGWSCETGVIIVLGHWFTQVG